MSREHRVAGKVRRVLMIDIGGGSVKVMVSGRRTTRSFETGDNMSPDDMVVGVKRLTHDWAFDCVSIGYPGPVLDGMPSGDPPRVGRGWVRFDYAAALGRPVRLINDASLQALAAYRGKRMLFLGLGTGLGSTLIVDHVLVPLELGWLRFDRHKSLLQRLADNGPQRLGVRCWRRDVLRTMGDLKAAFNVEEVVVGGGNAARLAGVPEGCRTRLNSQAMLGAHRLWGDAKGVHAKPRGTLWEIRGL